MIAITRFLSIITIGGLHVLMIYEPSILPIVSASSEPSPSNCLYKNNNQNLHKKSSSTAFASKSIPPPPSISVPVYSLAAPAPTQETKQTSMNIITFCTPVSVSPPKLWTISLYHNTMTKDYFFGRKIGILQLLDKNQGLLVPILGKRSGYEENYSKEVECAKIGYEWTNYMSNIGKGQECDEEEEERIFRSIQILPNCQSYIKFRILETVGAGDHEVALCQVLGVGRWDDKLKCVVSVDPNSVQRPKDENVVLYTGYLRQEGII